MKTKPIRDLERFNRILETASTSGATVYFRKNDPGSVKVFSSTWPIFEWLYNLFGYANYLKNEEALDNCATQFDLKSEKWVQGRTECASRISHLGYKDKSEKIEAEAQQIKDLAAKAATAFIKYSESKTIQNSDIRTRKTAAELRHFNKILETALSPKEAGSRAKIYFPKFNSGSPKVFSSTWPIFEWLYNRFGYASMEEGKAIRDYYEAFKDRYSIWSEPPLLKTVQENFTRYIHERNVTYENFPTIPD